MSHEPFDIERQTGPDELRVRLVDELREGGSIRTIGVATAFSEVPRELFIPEVAAERGLEAVYQNEAYVTKEDAHGMPLSSSSQPGIMAEMLELLELEPGQRVLEVGAGTGYNAALLSRLVGGSGRVVTVDVDPEIAARAQSALGAMGAPVDVLVGDGRTALAASAPYDRIIVTASAAAIPRAWLEQLADGGRLVVPLRLDADADAIQLISAFVRRGRSLHSVESTWGGFMPLHGGEGASQAPKASLQASLSSGDRGALLVSLTGSALERLSEAAAKRLVSVLLRGTPRTGAEGTSRLIGGAAPAVLIYLMVRIPDRRRVWIRHGDRHGVGLLDAKASGVAAVTMRNVWDPGAAKAHRGRWRLEGWGTAAAFNELKLLVADWQELQRAGRDRLEITTRAAGDPLRLEFNWAD